MLKRLHVDLFTLRYNKIFLDVMKSLLTFIICQVTFTELWGKAGEERNNISPSKDRYTFWTLTN